MKLVGMLFLCLLSLNARAFESNRTQEEWKVFGYYGATFVSPSDINGIANAQATTPKLNAISTDYLYGGGLGFKFSHRFQVVGSYEIQDAKNAVNTTAPNISGAGFELLQNEIWAGLNYFIFDTGKTYFYLGGSLGYATYSHVTSTLASKTDYDADKNLGYRAQLGMGVVVLKHLSLFAETGYQFLASGTIKNGAGAALTTSSGANAKMDLSGVRALGGVAFLF